MYCSCYFHIFPYINFKLTAGNAKLIKQLIEAGVDINTRDSIGMTALYVAACSGELDIVHELVRHGATINLKTGRGTCPLSIAAHFGHNKVVRYLISHGADTDNMDFKTAIENGPKEIATLLEGYRKLAEKAKTNLTYELFQQAVQAGYCGIVKTILESNKLCISKEDIALAKTQWLKTKDPIYKDIGRLLIPYCDLLQKVGTSQQKMRLPKEIIELIASLV
jgi:Ankyrin repeats (3 copies)